MSLLGSKRVTLFWLRTGFMCWLILSGCWPLTLCSLPPSQRSCDMFQYLKCSSPFPTLPTLAWGSPVTCANQQPLSKPLKASILLSEDEMGHKWQPSIRTQGKDKTGWEVLLHAAPVSTFVKILVAPIPYTLILNSIILCTVQLSNYYNKLKCLFYLFFSYLTEREI